MRTAKALARLCGCAGSPEPLLVAYVISTIISFSVSKRLFDGVRGGTKLERRQSVAVMERTHKTPKKSKSKFLLKSPRGEIFLNLFSEIDMVGI